MKKLLLKTGSRVINYFKELDKTTDEEVYREIYSADSINNRRFYNIGAGNFEHPCWTNVDGGSEYYSKLYGDNQQGINHDLFDHKPLPVQDNSAEIVYTSHTIGHVDDPSVEFLFRDTYRMLKPGGVFRIVTPDVDLYYRAWRSNDRRFFDWIYDERFNVDIEKQCLNTPLSRASTTQLFIEEFAAAASEIALVGADKRVSDAEFEQLFITKSYEDALNYCTSLCSIEVQRKFPFRHMNWFNEKKLKSMLAKAGFQMVYRSGFMQSTAPVLRNSKYFDKTVPKLSIYMEAVK